MEHDLHRIIPAPFRRAKQLTTYIVYKTSMMLVAGRDERIGTKLDVYPRCYELFEGTCIIATSRVCASLELVAWESW